MASQTSVFLQFALPLRRKGKDWASSGRWQLLYPASGATRRTRSFFKPSPPPDGVRLTTGQKLSRRIMSSIKGAASSGPDWPGSQVPDVRIDTGVFKYVLMIVSDDKANEKTVVRGDKSCPYHMDVYEACVAEMEPLGLKVRETGGGRIRHSEEDKSILVYGYSQAFGQADHNITVSLLRKCYPSYKSIEMSNEGY